MHRTLATVFLGGVLFLAAPGVDLGGFFGDANASAKQSSADRIELRLSVEAEAGEAVVAHLIEPGGEQQTFPLPETSSGLYLIITEVRKVNFIVVFELVSSEAGGQSQPLLLTDLGVAPAVLGILTTAPDLPDGGPSNSWGWAGLGFGALSLLALAFWALPGRQAADNAKTQTDDSL